MRKATIVGYNVGHSAILATLGRWARSVLLSIQSTIKNCTRYYLGFQEKRLRTAGSSPSAAVMLAIIVIDWAMYRID